MSVSKVFPNLRDFSSFLFLVSIRKATFYWSWQVGMKTIAAKLIVRLSAAA